MFVKLYSGKSKDIHPNSFLASLIQKCLTLSEPREYIFRQKDDIAWYTCKGQLLASFESKSEVYAITGYILVQNIRSQDISDETEIYCDLEKFKADFSEYSGMDFSKATADFPLCTEIPKKKFTLHYRNIKITGYLPFILTHSRLVIDQCFEGAEDLYVDVNFEDIKYSNLEVLQYLGYQYIGWELFKKAKIMALSEK